jgi:predicted GH43/DUF377 family glycosyl hydrolase
VSSDGLRFERSSVPVLFPDEDEFMRYEWPGGCEDIHVVEDDSGTYYLYYTTWTGKYDTMCVAVSDDLEHWTKHGPVFGKLSPESVIGSRSGVVVTELRQGKLLPAKIGGKYYMYYTHPSYLAESENLIDWKTTGKSVWPDGRHESGAIALRRDDGILLMFNGQDWGELPFMRGTWTLGQALIAPDDLTTVLEHQDRPFLYPELPWEVGGDRYRAAVLPPIRNEEWENRYSDTADSSVTLAVVANSLVWFDGQWLLYYGAADRYIGVARCR